MAGSGKHHKLVVAVLSTACFSIWGVIMYQFLWSMDSVDNSHLVIVGTKADKHTGLALDNQISTERLQNLSDPFFPVAQKKNTLKPKAVVVKPIEHTPLPEPKPLMFTGLITDSESKLAILRDTDGSVFFCAEGDSLHNLHIVKITPGELELSHGERRYVIKLQK